MFISNSCLIYFVRIRAYKVALFMSEMIYWLKENRFVLHFKFSLILGMISYMLDLFLNIKSYFFNTMGRYTLDDMIIFVVLVIQLGLLDTVYNVKELESVWIRFM